MADLSSPSFTTRSDSSDASAVIIVDRPRDDELEALDRFGRARLSNFATVTCVRRLRRRNSDVVVAIFRSETTEIERKPAGFYALLPLSDAGASALESGTLDVSDPPDWSIVESGARPAAIYLWAVVAPGLVDRTLDKALRLLGPLYGAIPIISTAATVAGERTLNRFGFQAGDHASFSLPAGKAATPELRP